MKKKQKIEYKYTCKFCGKEYTEELNQCPGCGAVEFVQSAYILSDSVTVTTADEKKSRFKLIKIFLIIVAISILGVFALITLGIIGYVAEEISYSDYKTLEYEYSEDLKDDPSLFIGKNHPDYEKNYMVDVNITGSFYDLYNGIYKNIYASQFNTFDYTLPCNMEVKTDNFELYITAIEMFCYGKNSDVEITYNLSGTIDKDVAFYMVDKEGNRDRMLIQRYEMDEFETITEYLNTDVMYKKRFSVASDIIEYDKFVIVLDGKDTFECDLNYERASGNIYYYTLKEKK